MWVKEDAGEGCFFLKNVWSNLYVGVDNAVMQDGRRIIQWTKIPGHPDQIWCPEVQTPQ